MFASLSQRSEEHRLAGSFGVALVLLVRGVFTLFPGLNVTAEFQEDPWDAKLVEVNRCSAFSPPTAIACEKPCLHLRELPAAHISDQGDADFTLARDPGRK